MQNNDPIANAQEPSAEVVAAVGDALADCGAYGLHDGHFSDHARNVIAALEVAGCVVVRRDEVGGDHEAAFVPDMPATEFVRCARDFLERATRLNREIAKRFGIADFVSLRSSAEMQIPPVLLMPPEEWVRSLPCDHFIRRSVLSDAGREAAATWMWG